MSTRCNIAQWCLSRGVEYVGGWDRGPLARACARATCSPHRICKHGELTASAHLHGDERGNGAVCQSAAQRLGHWHSGLLHGMRVMSSWLRLPLYTVWKEQDHADGYGEAGSGLASGPTGP
eukprot:scaffold104_cov375-Prasinococcus_capsulatus_cf.AAC.14